MSGIRVCFSIVLLLLACVASGCQKAEPVLTSVSQAQSESILTRSVATTLTIGDDGRHLVSDYWYASGAKTAGFTLDAYTTAVQALNPGVKLDSVWDGEELRFPMEISAP